MDGGSGQETVITNLRTVDGAAPSAVERLLLTTDGTVTRMLEALTRRPVCVDIIERTVDEDDILYRKVALELASSGRALAWARSEVALSLFPDDAAGRLRRGEIGIGRLLREEEMETFRELRDVTLCREPSCETPSFVDAPTDELFERVYDICDGEKRLVRITEYFPRDFYDRYE